MEPITSTTVSIVDDEVDTQPTLVGSKMHLSVNKNTSLVFFSVEALRNLVDQMTDAADMWDNINANDADVTHAKPENIN